MEIVLRVGLWESLRFREHIGVLGRRVVCLVLSYAVRIHKRNVPIHGK